MSYSKAVELVSDIEERLTKCYDDALLMLPGKERVCEKLTGECNKLTKQCFRDELLRGGRTIEETERGVRV